MTTEALFRLGFFLGILIILALWEYKKPRRPWSHSKLKRWGGNFGFGVFNAVLIRGLFGLTLFGVGLYGQEQGWGLFRWWGLPVWANWILGILILDWAVWFQHLLFHIIPFLWPIHRMHHTDLDFDVSTGLRFHPAEILPSFLYKAGLVLLLGIDPWPALVFEILLNGFSQFTHTNVRLGKNFEGLFRWVFVTPEMHRIHHSVLPREHNRNYGFSFSFWDRWFRTYLARAEAPQETMEIGIEGFRDPKRLNFLRLFIQPLTRQKKM